MVTIGSVPVLISSHIHMRATAKNDEQKRLQLPKALRRKPLLVRKDQGKLQLPFLERLKKPLKVRKSHEKLQQPFLELLLRSGVVKEAKKVKAGKYPHIIPRPHTLIWNGQMDKIH
jgi:hypothetical protein